MSPHTDYALRMPHVTVNNADLHYLQAGSGDDILLLCGLGDDVTAWDGQFGPLSERYRVTVIDNRGVGRSSLPDGEFTVRDMADDAAGLIKALGFKKANILAFSMGARIGQQVLIRHPDLVNKAVLCAADPGGKYDDPAAPDVEAKLNNPDAPKMERLALTVPDNEAGQAALKAALARIKAAVASGIIPDDFDVSKQTTERQDRARTTLWKADNSNFENLKNIKVPVLIADGRDDAIDPPKNSLIIANQIPFSWLAFFDGGHSFLYTSPKHFADTVNAFLQ